jgi:hypothetical protein
MAHSNRPMTSREFKIMLVPNEFIDRKAGIHKVTNVIDSLIEKQGGSFKNEVEEKKRRTWYLDTDAHELNDNKFLFRIREEKKTDEYGITLKCRHPDRYISASHDLTSSRKDVKMKFEEDVVTPFISKFSLSATLKEVQKPEFGTFKELLSVFPGLSLDIGAEESLNKVNNFEAIEVACEIGKIIFAGEKSVKSYLNLWYIPTEEKPPRIVEFTFDYGAKETDDPKGVLLEEFPHSLVREADAFYISFQDNNIVDHDSEKTKTEYAYQYKSS